MGWLDTALDADSATQAAITVSKIEDLIEEDAPVTELEALSVTLKQTLVNLRTAAEEINGRTDLPLKITAGGMILLEMRLQESRISPEHFFNQADRDYTDAAIQLIRGQGNRLITQLTSADQDEVRDMVLNARRMADYAYFIDHFKDGDDLITAADIVDILGWRNSLSGLLILWIGFILILIGLATIPIIMLMNGQDVSGYIGFVFLVIIAAVGFIFTSRWIKANDFKDAMAVIDELGNQMDIDRFETIHKELDGKKNRAVGFQKSAQVVVEKFFFGLPVPTLREYFLEPAGVSLDEEEIPDMPAQSTPAFSNVPQSQEITARPSSRPALIEPRPAYVEPQPSYSDGRTDMSEVHVPVQSASPTSVARFCGQCGAKTPPGATFCPNCGNRLH